MPIIRPEAVGSDDRFFNQLEVAGVPLLTEEEAIHRDIRPARIGLLNLMPASAMEATEVQWTRWMSHSVLQIEPVPIKFDKDARADSGASRAEILAGYIPFSEVAEAGLDGLIVTGDNQEIEPNEGGLASGAKPREFKDLRYAKKLAEIVDWAQENVPSTIYSCLGAHYALNHFHGLERKIDTKEKIFGVYRHDVDAPDSPFVKDMNRVIIAPHSRWGNISMEQMDSVSDLRTLAVSQKVGWLLAEALNNADGTDLFIQGHPEYSERDLDAEYQRDRGTGQPVPESYYDNDDPDQPIQHNWVTDARALHANYIAGLYERFSQEKEPDIKN